jgi:hypothetical protein
MVKGETDVNRTRRINVALRSEQSGGQIAVMDNVITSD